MDVTPIDTKNEAQIVSMNQVFNVVHKYHTTLLSSNYQEDRSTGTEFEPAKLRICCHTNAILGLILKK